MNTQQRIQQVYRTQPVSFPRRPADEDGEYLLHNRIRCKLCHDVIESYNRHDFKYCSCGAVAVDGGLEYRRRLGSDYEEESEWSHLPTKDPLDGMEF